MSGDYLLIDGMDQYETERFFRYIFIGRMPEYIRHGNLSDMAQWFFRKCYPVNYKFKILFAWRLTDEPWNIIKNNGGYLV
jgi:hypothetical protein